MPPDWSAWKAPAMPVCSSVTMNRVRAMAMSRFTGSAAKALRALSTNSCSVRVVTATCPFSDSGGFLRKNLWIYRLRGRSVFSSGCRSRLPL
jgi:hypothetical protein